jgi:cytochrome P450
MSPVSVDFDPFSPEVVADPYPYYEHLLEHAPVCWVPAQEMWMVTRHEDVTSVLRNPGAFSSAGGFDALFGGRVGRRHHDMRSMSGLDLRELRILIATDPPDHTRLRRLVGRALTPKAMADLEPKLRRICSQIVGDFLARVEDGDADVVEELAIPFPVIVIAELLGVPRERRHEFRKWSDASVGALSGDLDLAEAQAAQIGMLQFMAEMVEQRRVSPRDDLISQVVTGHDPDDPEALSFLEIAMFAILLLVAGNETTTNLIGNAWAAFAANPDQADLLRANPDLLVPAIEEVLRYDSPVQGLVRATTQPVSLGGVEIPEGALVLASFAAANRDPKRFEEPGRFDIRRRPTEHMGFGHGIHFCLGASLARLEARLVGETLLERNVRLEPTGAAKRTDSFILRGFSKYPVRQAQNRGE